jgi:hypothetical protein
MMTAGFEGDVEGSALCGLTRGRERIDLSVRLAVMLVPTFTDELAVAHYDGADERIRLDVSPTAFR